MSHLTFSLFSLWTFYCFFSSSENPPLKWNLNWIHLGNVPIESFTITQSTLQDGRFRDSLQWRRARPPASRGRYLFDREKLARLKIHQSIGTRRTWFQEPRLNWTWGVTPRRVFILPNRVNTTFQRVVLMVGDWRRLGGKFSSESFQDLFSPLSIFYWRVVASRSLNRWISFV